MKAFSIAALAAVMTISLLGGVLLPVSASAQTTGGLSVHLVADEHEVLPRDVVQFTAVITNTSNVRQNDVLANLQISGDVDYISGSGYYRHSETGNRHSLPTSWLDVANFGYIEPGENVTLTWDMRVERNADVDEWFQVAFSTRSNENPTPLVATKKIYIMDERDAQMTISKIASREVANPGDVITYTITIENDGDLVFHNLKVVENLPNDGTKWVTYVKNSTERTLEGEKDDIDDDWIEDGYNLNYLNPGDKLKITFDVKVRSDAPHGLILHNVVNVKADELDEWAQAAANTTVHVPGAPTPQPPVKKPELPKTGVGGIFVAVWSLAASGLGSGAFYAGRKFILG